jgi:hypothetical protein
MPSQRSKRGATTESLRAHETQMIAAEALRSTLLQSPAGAAKRRRRRVNVYNGPSDTSAEEDDEGTGNDETSTETPLQRIRLKIGVGSLHKKTQALADELMDEERSSSPPPHHHRGRVILMQDSTMTTILTIFRYLKMKMKVLASILLKCLMSLLLTKMRTN